jgi:hypothetical protein
VGQILTGINIWINNYSSYMFRQDFKDGVGHIEIEKIKILSPNPAQTRREPPKGTPFYEGDFCLCQFV